MNVYNELVVNPDLSHFKNKSFLKVNRPCNLRAARRVGYKCKPGFFIVQTKIKKGSRISTPPNAARRTKAFVPRYTLDISNKKIIKNRVARKFKALEVLNAYKIAEQNKFNFFEVILYDPNVILLNSVPKGRYSFRSE